MEPREPLDRTHATAAAAFGSRPRSAAARWMRLILGLGVLVAAVFVAVYASRREKPDAAAAGHEHGAAAASNAAQPVMLTAEQARRIGVSYATVERGVLDQEVRTVGQVTFDETKVRTVTLKFDGWVETLFVDYTGRDVRAGEPLLSAYSPMLVAAEQELVLAAKLIRDVSGADSSTRAGARDLHAAARQRLLNWDVPVAELDRVERTGEVPKTLTLRAPYSGVIVDKLVLGGQRIMAGDPLYRVADLSVVWVEGEVFERDLALVHLGDAVDVDLQALIGATRKGRIVFLQPTVSADTRTMRVRVALDNANGQLKPGMYATVRIRGAGGVPVLHVPRSAVMSTGTRDLVFVQRTDGMLEPRAVGLGIATDDRVQIVKGLTAGETVVASATFLIDAESNLGSMLGGMAGMPGMDMTPPASGAKTAPSVPPGPAPASAPAKAPPPMGAMPGMDMSPPPKTPAKAPAKTPVKAAPKVKPGTMPAMPDMDMDMPMPSPAKAAPTAKPDGLSAMSSTTHDDR